MKKWFVCLLVVLCLLGVGAACAESMVGVDPSLVNVLTPEGLEWAQEPVLTQGALSLVIDSQKTNWAAAISDTGENNVQVITQFKAPAGVQPGGYLSFVITDEGEANALEALKSNEEYGNFYYISSIDSNGFVFVNGGMPYPENGNTVAEYLADINYLLPVNVNYVFALAWYDSSRQLIGNYQKFALSIGHTATSAFQINPLKGTPASRVIANADNNAQVTVLEQKDGSVTYQAEKGVEVVTRVFAPEGAVSYAYGSIKAKTTGDLAADGSLTFTNITKQGPHTSSQGIRFYDAAGKLISVEQLALHYQPADNLAWPAYEEEITPVPASRLKVTNSAQQGGFSYTYDESTGHVETFYQKAAAGQGASKLGYMTLEVKPYVDEETGKKAKYFRFSTEQQNHDILGMGTSSIEKHDQKMDSMWNGYIDSTEDYLPFFEIEAFRKVEPRDNDIVIYIPGTLRPQYFANLVVVYWYENADDAEPMKREYFWETNVPATLVDKVKPVASEQDLERPVKKPHIIGPHGKDYSKWHLVVTSYYQEGKNARHYELSLEDENGNPVELSEELAIYLPYPNGFNYGDEETTFALRHYSSDLYSENNPNLHGRQVMVIPTEYGLKFVTSTFSPFIVSWETEEPEAVVPDEPSVPQTGDDTQLGLLFVLMAASALLGTALLRRKTAHK